MARLLCKQHGKQKVNDRKRWTLSCVHTTQNYSRKPQCSPWRRCFHKNQSLQLWKSCNVYICPVQTSHLTWMCTTERRHKAAFSWSPFRCCIYLFISLEVGSLKQMVVKHLNKSINIVYFPGVHMILSNPYMFLVLLRPSDLKILLKCLRLVPAYTSTVKSFQHAPDDWVNIQSVQCWDKQSSNWIFFLNKHIFYFTVLMTAPFYISSSFLFNGGWQPTIRCIAATNRSGLTNIIY